MQRGDYEDAWQISDRVLASRGRCPPEVPRHEQWLWDGTPLDNRRVLIHCYHGLGDTIQFIRYIPLVARRARSVTVWAQPALLPLLATVSGIGRLIPLHNGDPGIRRDLDIEIMELPHIFRTTRSTVPADVPYLHPGAQRAIRGAGYNVGVVWAGGDWDPRRSIPFRDIESLAKLQGVTLHVLQRGRARSEAPSGWGRQTGSDRIAATAAVMRALDLVITVDSMPAHLAGALGVPVWTLLHLDHDWRWPADGSITPWYPTMRLIRQRHEHQWSDVIAEVATRLIEER
jgi:hypothetical protein